MLVRSIAPIGVLLASAGALAADDQGPTPEALLSITQSVAPSLVQVEWTAQYDKGESPGSDRWGSWRAYQMGGGSDADPDAWADWDQFITQERPKSIGGFVIDERHVFTADTELHPRFLKKLQVRFGSNVVDAKPSAYCRDGSGLILELDSPLAGVKALKFDSGRKEPFFQVAYRLVDGAWQTRVDGVSSSAIAAADGHAYAPGRTNVLYVDKDGTPVGLGTGDRLLSGWKFGPAEMKTASATEYAEMLKRIEGASNNSILRTTINFRSPRSDQGDRFGMGRYMHRGMGADSEITEWNGASVVVDPGTVLVLGKFAPKITGRLERITVFTQDGQSRTAKFAGTLKDWGAFWATLDQPIGNAAKLSTDDPLSLRDKLLAKAEINIRGETRTPYFSHARFSNYYTAYKGRVFPGVSGSGGGRYNYGGDSSPSLNYFFSGDGSLVGLPIERRESVATQDRYGFSSGQVLVVPAGVIAELARDRTQGLDPENRPLIAEEENRLAWLGVEMQPMDPELARANKMMDETNGGTSGGMVTHLYAGSPAEKVGIQVGDVILRLDVEGQPKPIEVTLQEGFDAGMMDQFWQYLDQMPAEYFDQMPKPWGSVENPITRALTDVGFGTKFVAEIWRDGKVMKKDMVVTEGPKYFDSAARYKTPESIGLTVRDITYEVRRYFQMSDEDPGVIISKLESGSRAAVAGLKPMEILRTANDKPIRDVKDFEAIVKAGGEVKLGVKRMTTGRTVKLKLDDAAPAKPTAPTTAEDADAAPVSPSPAPR